MAYVVARANRRFEVREALHTPSGPRARTLANFASLTDEVIAKAARRATRGFDAEAVVASARRAGAPVVTAPAGEVRAARQFVDASRRMARSVQRSRVPRRADPGQALVELLGFADAVACTQPPRPFEPLGFPVLSRLAPARRPPALAR